MVMEDFKGLEDITPFEGGAPTSYSSPDMPGAFDPSASISSSVSNLGTVSPHDLLLAESFMSAPNSTAMTALTSPSIYDGSPSFADNFDVSPNFGTDNFDSIDSKPWFPLFPQNEVTPTAPQAKAPDRSPTEESEDLEPEASPMSKRRKSGNFAVKHSSVAGVNARRRDKPLPPIVIEDPNDTVAMKRARNTLAARKSRQRRQEKMEELQEKVDELTRERDYWRDRCEQMGGNAG